MLSNQHQQRGASRNRPGLAQQARSLVAEIEQLAARQRERVREDVSEELEARRLSRRLAMVVEHFEATDVAPSLRMPRDGSDQVYSWLKRLDPPGNVTWLATKIRKANGEPISRQHLYAVLAGDRDISPSLAQRLSDVTGIDIELLTPIGASWAVAS